jgi:hypothetical protein
VAGVVLNAFAVTNLTLSISRVKPVRCSALGFQLAWSKLRHAR